MLKLDNIANGFTDRYPSRYTTIDSHTQGEPTRLLLDFTTLAGKTIAEKRDTFTRNHDHLRMLLTREPRGHRDMFAAILTEPVSPEASFGLIYMDARRYPYLCGHATIGAVTTLVETGVLEAEDGDRIITVDTPSGPLPAHTRIRQGRVESVGLDMLPAFVQATDCPVDVAGFGEISVDLVCVGGFFAMVSASSLNLELSPANSKDLINLGMAIIEAANRTLQVHHPERPEVNTIDVAEFYHEEQESHSGTSVVIYGESHMDRSPCGTGTTAKMTLLHHKGRLQPGRIYRNSSPLGTVFAGEIIDQLHIGEFPGIRARIHGSAVITGYHQFVVHQEDPFPQGFLVA